MQQKLSTHVKYHAWWTLSMTNRNEARGSSMALFAGDAAAIMQKERALVLQTAAAEPHTPVASTRRRPPNAARV